MSSPLPAAPIAALSFDTDPSRWITNEASLVRINLIDPSIFANMAWPLWRVMDCLRMFLHDVIPKTIGETPVILVPGNHERRADQPVEPEAAFSATHADEAGAAEQEVMIFRPAPGITYALTLGGVDPVRGATQAMSIP